MNQYINNPELLQEQKLAARNYSLKYLSIDNCRQQLNEIISNVNVVDNLKWCKLYLEKKNKEKKSEIQHEMIDLFCPKIIESKIRESRENRRKNAR